MNKEQREVYLTLASIEIPHPTYKGTEIAGISLCWLCRYARWRGICLEAELDCQHPLSDLEVWDINTAWEGGDCWAFRPRKELTVDLVADWIGQRLQGQMVELPRRRN